ncbi:MAG: 2-oxoacid:acceptor oxidoreductase subunit alpha [Gammaproteobacteria bacterium]|nr:2-oxoacid:acceptor oxidoreductase subunit alpha [Gammaproteobacteria bacterium]
MTDTDIQLMFCGSAGDGTIAVGDIFKRAMAKAGYKVIAFDIYPPEIRGFGKCISRVRVTSRQAYSLKQQSDVLVSLNDSYAIPHVTEIRDFGSVIYDQAPIAPMAEGEHISGHLLPGQLPYGLRIREISDQTTGGSKSKNIVALGYLAGLYGIKGDPFHQIIQEKFQHKDPSISETNLRAFDTSYDEGASTFRLDFIELGTPERQDVGNKVQMMTGNAAVVRGCLDAGLNNFFGYPITPATSIMESLATELPRRGGRIVQTEDEISAIAATIGAGYAGTRAATATSGPGLALMIEMLGLGVMAEVPSVIFCSQRGGPSTGMPTKTEQSDLHLAVYGGAGDAQRIVLAPTNVEGAYKCAGKAFEMAEKYQTPVIVLLDLYLSNRYETVVLPRQNPFEADSSKYRSHLERGVAYNRFALTEDNISPRTIPGEEGGIHTITGLEHNEMGRPNDQIHSKMSEKRHNKLLQAFDHPGITIHKRFGGEGKVDVGILGWGSTFGEIFEAMLMAQAEGINCSAMKVVMLSPLPSQPIKEFFSDCGEILIPELNYEGQFANLVASAVSQPFTRLNRVPGVPMQVEDILNQIRHLADRVKSPTAA